MTDDSQKDLYCCVAPEFSDALAGHLEKMRDGGYRVLVGNDPEELLLLLELSKPKALLYTIEAEGANLLSGFRVIEKRALEQGLPLIVVRTSPSGDGGLESALWLPSGGSGFERIPMDIEDITDRLGELIPRSGFVEASGAAGTGGEDPFGDQLRDFVRDGDKVLEVETRFVPHGTPRIRTTVTGRQGLVLQEDQPADPLDADLASKIEAQHMLALAVYRSRDKEEVEEVEAAYHRDISQPIVLPSVSQEGDYKNEGRDGAAWIGAALAAGTVISLLAALFFMIAPTSNGPQVLDRRVGSNGSNGALQPATSPGSAGGTSTSTDYLLWPPYEGDTEDDSTAAGEAEQLSL